jgi:hypothetical protein
MRYSSLQEFLTTARSALAKSPVAIIFAEDPVEVDTTLRHYMVAGFAQVIVFADPVIPLNPEVEAKVHRIDTNVYATGAMVSAVNRLIEAAPGIWMYYGYNAEYLFFPFCETRNIRDLVAFQTEERRNAFLSYVVDLYAGDLEKNPDAVNLEDAHLDKSGYYALARLDADNHYHPLERQLDFFGGLRWRFEEHVPWTRRKIDRIALFKAKPGLILSEDFTFNDPEYNTYACQWHHNITTAVVSFRTAKALSSNAASKFDIQNYRWHNSVPFEWHSQQLMDLGLMEPGQWF